MARRTTSNGSRRAAAFREIRSFEQHLARIEQRRRDARHVGRRGDPGRPVLIETAFRRRQPHGNDFERRADSVARVQQPGQLAERQPVSQRNRRPADKALDSRVPAAALRRSSRRLDWADRGARPECRAAAQAAGNSASSRRTYRPACRHPADRSRSNRARVSISAVGCARLAVQAVDRETERLIAAVRRLDHVRLLFAPQAVLRREDGGELPGNARPAGSQA